MNLFPMNNNLNPALLATLASTIVVASASASWAAATQITAVEVTTVSNGIELRLQTQGGDRPQVFAVPRGDSWVADVINTELSLSSGSTFSEQNPAEGIRSITIAPLDSNSVRITITGEDGAPDAQLTDRANNTLTFGVIPRTGNEAIGQSLPVTSPAPATSAPEVLFPNPEIKITDNTASAPIPRQNPAPAFLPRAVAPPLGDIAVSNLVPNIGNEIDLGTAQRVPRLALRDAPAREVLALLARAAGLNLAYIGNAGEGASSSTPSSSAPGTDGTTTTVAAPGGEGPTITLDIENEPVQDVFNYVLKLTELQAVRQGRTILVGPELPQDTRNTIVRTLRINQADVTAVANYLVAQGAEARLVQNVTTRTVTGEGTVNQAVQETSNTQVVSIAPQESTVGAPTILKGLTVVTDDRLNTLTLVGNPNIVDLATSFSKQLDLRQRQVAVNVKVVDLTLDNQSTFTSSFSFGLGDAFVVNDAGQGAINIGEFAPAGSTDANDAQLNRPLISNPYNALPTVVDFNQSVAIPSTVQIINNATGQVVGSIPVTGEQFVRTSTLTDDAFDRVVQVTGGTPGQLRFTDTNSNGVFDLADTVVNFVGANFGTVTQTIPNIIQYPDEFLLRLRSQIVSQNAKVLTDPTLIIQEGQNATVNLTDQVLTEVTESITQIEGTNQSQVTTELEYEEVGLILSITVPRIDDNGFITMEVQPRITSAVSSFPFRSSTSGNIFTIFQTGKRELNSGKIRMRDGQTLILAGIVTEDDQEQVTKWPILGDLPIIGSLFRNTTKEVERSEVIIVVTPQILDDSDNSSYGYNYAPSPEVQRVLDQRKP